MGGRLGRGSSVHSHTRRLDHRCLCLGQHHRGQYDELPGRVVSRSKWSVARCECDWWWWRACARLSHADVRLFQFGAIHCFSSRQLYRSGVRFHQQLPLGFAYRKSAGFTDNLGLCCYHPDYICLLQSQLYLRRYGQDGYGYAESGKCDLYCKFDRWTSSRHLLGNGYSEW